VNVLVVAAHPDDETLGCGGTLLRHRARGHGVHWLIATQAHAPAWAPEVIQRKAGEIASVAEAYGMESVARLGFPAARLDTVPQADLVDGVRAVVDRVRPDVVYLTHLGDVHADHRIVSVAAFSVLKASYMKRWGLRRILCYETLSSTETAPFRDGVFVPTVFHDITPHVERKIEIMSAYATESHQDPAPRGPSAIRALARYRGATIGVEYAEAFVLMREVD